MPRKKHDSGLVEQRQLEQKKLIVEQLQKVPIVQVACEKVGIGRATFYRWMKDDPMFAKDVDAALKEGVGFINDLAETQLLSSIKDKQFNAISFWLKHRHKEYATKVQMDARITEGTLELTPEQEALIADALKALSEQRENILNEINYDRHTNESTTDPERIEQSSTETNGSSSGSHEGKSGGEVSNHEGKS